MHLSLAQEKLRRERLIKQYTTLYHYAKPKYKDVDIDYIAYKKIKKMVRTKLYMAYPFNLSVFDIIYYCSKKLFKTWKKDKKCLLNIKIHVLFDLTEDQYNYISSNRNRLLKTRGKT